MSAFDARSDSEGQTNQRLLATLHRLLTITPTSVAAALDAAATQVADALRAEKSDAFLYEDAGDLLDGRGHQRDPDGAAPAGVGLASPLHRRWRTLCRGLHDTTRPSAVALGITTPVNCWASRVTWGCAPRSPRRWMWRESPWGVSASELVPAELVLRGSLRCLEAVALAAFGHLGQCRVTERAGAQAEEPLEPGWRQNLLRWRSGEG